MEDLFEIQRNCLRLMGHNFNDNNNNNTIEEKTPGYQKLHTTKYIASLLLVLSAQWPMINYAIYHIDDLALATASLSILFTNVLTMIKITTFLLYKQKFVQMMEQFEDMFQGCMKKARMFRCLGESQAKDGLIEANKLAMKLVRVYYYCVAATGVYFMIGPIMKIVWANIRQSTIVKELPMPMRFPFDFESTPGYECCYIYTGFVTIVVVMYASAIDGLFLSFTINLRAHFQALQYFITTNSFCQADKDLQRDIGSYVQYHILLLHLAKRVRETYEPIVFGQFLMTSLQMCVIVYQLVTHMDVIMVLVVYVTFLCSILLQLFIYCYGGEIIKNESSMVGIAVQISNWYNLPPKYRRMLCLVMHRSQREAIIKAGFYEASLANFMMIIKAAMSYITLIQSIE